ncbi:MAG: hypothetical protein IPL96_03705 [Holophagaceae bacterium]|nr:hypothetical protein [Holophagaceae bacterium]
MKFDNWIPLLCVAPLLHLVDKPVMRTLSGDQFNIQKRVWKYPFLWENDANSFIFYKHSNNVIFFIQKIDPTLPLNEFSWNGRWYFLDLGNSKSAPVEIWPTLPSTPASNLVYGNVEFKLYFSNHLLKPDK